MNKLLQLYLMTINILFPLMITGQSDIIIKGKVTDNLGNPLIYANLVIVNELYGSSTDYNGDYIIKLTDDYTSRYVIFEVKYLGYISQQKNIQLVRGINTYNFQMERDVLSLKPVIVTAQRREEYLQNVPISITTMNSQEIENRGINGIIELQNSIPNFFLGDGTFNRIAASSIRGIAGASRAAGIETRANYYIDDVYMGRSVAVGVDLLDLERIEILKGPQGTLFGKNTVSGVINITTHKPIDEWQGIVSIEAGNLNYINSNLIINAPLVENKLFTRFSGKLMRRDGHVKNLFDNNYMNGLNILNGKLQIRWLPSSYLDINLSMDALRDRRDNRTYGEALQGEGYDAAPKIRELSHDADEFEHRDILGISLRALYKFSNNYNLKSITAYRKINDWGKIEEDLTPRHLVTGDEIDKDFHFTQELRLTSPVFKNFNFITGLFYFYQKSDQKFTVFGTADAPNPNFTLISEGPVATNSIAGYFHSNLNLTSNLFLFGGLRYTYEYKAINWNQVNWFLDNQPGFYINLEDYTDKYSKGTFSPQIGVRYKILSQLMLYGKATWGYKSGGWGNHTVQSLESLKLKPEYVVSFEAGVKSTFFNDRLSFNTALFLSKFDDFQSEIWQPTSPPFDLILPIYTNAAQVTSKGFELEIITIPFNNLSIFGSLGYVNAVYDKFIVPTEFDYVGNKLELAPETEYNFSMEYKIPFTDFGTFIFRGDFIHKDDYYFDASNKDYYHIQGYDLLDVKIGYENLNSVWKIFLWSKNLFDKLYMLNKAIAPIGTPFAWYAIPRTFGVQVTYSFL